MFTIATDGYGAFVLNLHASLARLGLERELMVYSLDAAVHETLLAAGVRSIPYAAGARPACSPFGSHEFGQTMAYKYAIALDVLHAGRLAYYVDSDIVFLRDPTEHLHGILGQTRADLVMQIEAPMQVYNAGFWIARPTAAARDLFAALCAAIRNAGEYVDDQKTINRWIKEEKRVQAQPLDPKLFACGNQFLGGMPLEQGGWHVDHPADPFQIASAYVLHFNFLTTREQKAAAMVRHRVVFHPSVRSLRPGWRRWFGRLERSWKCR
jgi:hypothetical protein